MTDSDAETQESEMVEGFVEIDGEGFYLIPDVERLGEFLMSIVSDSDHWMYISSRGGLTVGRRTAASALFPYETEDRLHRASGLTGPVTLIRRVGPDENGLWEPLRDGAPKSGRRNLYKSVVGNQVIFEETNDDLGLAFRYRWSNSERFGFVRRSTLVNTGNRPVTLEVLDGLLNILPAGLSPALYRGMSVLTHAYKRSELIDLDTRLAVYSLESQVSDRPEPAESLSASVAWSAGFAGAEVGTNSDLVEAFRNGRSTQPTTLLTGRPGAYLISGTTVLDPSEETSWMIVADVDQDQSQVVSLRRFLSSAPDPVAEVAASVRAGTDAMVALMAHGDALQRTGDRVATANHFTKVTYNAMRGGIFTDIRTSNFADFLSVRNRVIAERYESLVAALPAVIDHATLLEAAMTAGDPQLTRLALEYLPLTFSRRHGDPSRPWNEFAIRVHDNQGRPAISYQGNWRDIFQNWEALAQSYPEYLPSLISVFVNASTPDGFNPYRISQDGIDWEVPEPDEPWSNIGYWGDHQIVYLMRLLEKAHQFLPGDLTGMLDRAWFSYADVPYRIAPYEQMLRDPKNTIEYDAAAADRSAARVAAVGNDGKLIWDEDGGVHLVTLLEKLLVPVLSKLSNYVPGGGIWMNTQRPEWNDSNNALVGYGLSMVTLYYLRRYIDILAQLAGTAESAEILMSREVADWLSDITAVFRSNVEVIGDALDDQQRRRITDRLGESFDRYRSRVYGSGFSGFAPVAVAAITELHTAVMPHLDDTIRRNRRPDGLYHSYNLVRFDRQSTQVEHMYEMLEGQVAVLGSGLLAAEEQADLLDALFASAMYRPDQRSFMLYPARHLPTFLEKNVVSPERVSGNPLLRSLVEFGDRSVVVADEDGRYRFSASFANGRDLNSALDRLGADERWRGLVAENRAAVLDMYEEVFHHHAFTGRSGTMYAYEGIGSIFWHMVGKLLVAVQQAVVEARAKDASPEILSRLIDGYWRVRSGLGFNKTAVEFGAFPTDPYSHTPAHAGAQQPGMTGEAKEEVLSRMLEIGVRIADGEVSFDPVLLRADEFVVSVERWPVIDLDGDHHVVSLAGGSLGMTLCQVPIVIEATSAEPAVQIMFADGTEKRVDGLRIDRETSRRIFVRSGDVVRVTAQVVVPAS